MAPRHNPNDIAIIMDISGVCDSKKCSGRRGNARLTAYYSGEILIRCHACNYAGAFTPDNASYNDPKTFLPFRDDEDPSDSGSGRYTKGRR